MNSIAELIIYWESKAQHFKRTAKQQRSACREGNSAKVRLLDKAVMAEEFVRQLIEVRDYLYLKEAVQPMVKQVLDDMDDRFLKSLGVGQPGAAVGTSDLRAKGEKFDADIERAASQLKAEQIPTSLPRYPHKEARPEVSLEELAAVQLPEFPTQAPRDD